MIFIPNVTSGFRPQCRAHWKLLSFLKGMTSLKIRLGTTKKESNIRGITCYIIFYCGKRLLFSALPVKRADFNRAFQLGMLRFPSEDG